MEVFVIWQRVFLEGNPYLLALTMAVSLLHTVFDFLAFKMVSSGHPSLCELVGYCQGTCFKIHSLKLRVASRKC